MVKKINSRGLVILVSMFAAFLALIIMRLIHLQIFNGDWYQELANRNRSFSEPIRADRGVFLDRYGQPITLNQPVYYQKLNPEQLFPERVPIERDTALQLMAQDPAQVGFSSQRIVTQPFSLAHVLGYVGPVTPEELDESSGLLHTESWTGKIGLERIFDVSLRGSDGFAEYEVNAQGQRIHLLSKTEPKPGNNIATTLDAELSEVAYQAMGEHTGSVVILDVETGEILSLVSTPSFDASLMNQRHIDPVAEKNRLAQVSEYFDHPQKLFFNRAISGTYAPGSVFKLITSIAGLESDAFKSDTTVVDEGMLEVGEFSFANWYYTQYGGVEGEISIQRAISRSNDIFFYKAAEWTGPEKLAEFARLFGLGSSTGVELSGESVGLVPDPAWKEQTLGERWFLGNTYHFGIGQDNLLVTPIQMAQVLQAIGNRGVICPPSLIAGEHNPECSETGVSEESLELVLKGMLDACSTGGTAFPFFTYNESHRLVDKLPLEEIDEGAVACKTGTSEFGQADERGYRNTHAWFGAIIGTKNMNKQPDFPEKIAIMVLVESDELEPYKEGSTHASPVAKSIVDWLLGTAVTEVATESAVSETASE